MCCAVRCAMCACESEYERRERGEREGEGQRQMTDEILRFTNANSQEPVAVLGSCDGQTSDSTGRLALGAARWLQLMLGVTRCGFAVVLVHQTLTAVRLLMGAGPCQPAGAPMDSIALSLRAAPPQHIPSGRSHQ